MQYLRQSTASQEVALGYFVDSTDGNTEETALSIANTDIKIWKTGATTLANKNSGGATHISNGIYYAVLDATDTDTIGPMRIFVHVSGALTVILNCVVLDEAVYDVLFGTTAITTGGAITVTSGRVNADVTHIATAAVNTASAQLGVNVVNAAGTAWGSGAITAGSIAADAITAAKIATGAIDADALATDAVAEIADGVWDEAIAGHLTAGSTGAALNAAGSAGDPWSTALPGAYGAGTAGNIIGNNLNATVSSRASQTSLDTLDDYVDTEVAAIKAKTDNLPASPAATGDIPSAASIADAVWDESLAAHLTAGSTGEALALTIDGVTTINTKVDTIDTVVDAILVDTGTDGVLVATGAIGSGQFAAGAIDAAAIAANAIGSSELAATAAEEIADTILLRKLDRSGNGTDALDERTVVNALRALRNKQSIAAGTLTVTKEDDTTTAWTASVSTAAGNPISSIDPA